MTFMDERGKEEAPPVKLRLEGYKPLLFNSFQSTGMHAGTLLDPQDLCTLECGSKEIWELEKQKFRGSFSLISK